jgi:hypothetical protein
MMRANREVKSGIPAPIFAANVMPRATSLLSAANDALPFNHSFQSVQDYPQKIL